MKALLITRYFYLRLQSVFFFIARDETLRIRLETDTSSAEGKAESADAARNGKLRVESLRYPGYIISYLLCDIRHCFQLLSVMMHLLYATEA